MRRSCVPVSCRWRLLTTSVHGSAGQLRHAYQGRCIDFIERSCAAGDPNFAPDRAHIFSTASAMSGVLQAVSPWSTVTLPILLAAASTAFRSVEFRTPIVIIARFMSFFTSFGAECIDFLITSTLRRSCSSGNDSSRSERRPRSVQTDARSRSLDEFSHSRDFRARAGIPRRASRRRGYTWALDSRSPSGRIRRASLPVDRRSSSQDSARLRCRSPTTLARVRDQRRSASST